MKKTAAPYLPVQFGETSGTPDINLRYALSSIYNPNIARQIYKQYVQQAKRQNGNMIVDPRLLERVIQQSGAKGDPAMNALRASFGAAGDYASPWDSNRASINNVVRELGLSIGDNQRVLFPESVRKVLSGNKLPTQEDVSEISNLIVDNHEVRQAVRKGKAGVDNSVTRNAVSNIMSMSGRQRQQALSKLMQQTQSNDPAVANKAKQIRNLYTSLSNNSGILPDFEDMGAQVGELLDSDIKNKTVMGLTSDAEALDQTLGMAHMLTKPIVGKGRTAKALGKFLGNQAHSPMLKRLAGKRLGNIMTKSLLGKAVRFPGRFAIGGVGDPFATLTALTGAATGAAEGIYDPKMVEKRMMNNYGGLTNITHDIGDMIANPFISLNQGNYGQAALGAAMALGGIPYELLFNIPRYGFSNLATYGRSMWDESARAARARSQQRMLKNRESKLRQQAAATSDPVQKQKLLRQAKRDKAMANAAGVGAGATERINANNPLSGLGALRLGYNTVTGAGEDVDREAIRSINSQGVDKYNPQSQLAKWRREYQRALKGGKTWNPKEFLNLTKGYKDNYYNFNRQQQAQINKWRQNMQNNPTYKKRQAQMAAQRKAKLQNTKRKNTPKPLGPIKVRNM